MYIGGEMSGWLIILTAVIYTYIGIEQARVMCLWQYIGLYILASK
jgi:hypothetical protein